MNQTESLTSLKTLRETLEVDRGTIYRHAKKLNISTEKKIKNQTHFDAEDVQKITDSINKQRGVADTVASDAGSVADVAPPATDSVEGVADTVASVAADSESPEYLRGRIAELKEQLAESENRNSELTYKIGKLKGASIVWENQARMLEAQNRLLLPPAKKPGFFARWFAPKNPPHWENTPSENEGEMIEMDKPKPD